MKTKQDNYWISLADVMSGLMLIFLLIAVSFMWSVQQKAKQEDSVWEELGKARKEIRDELNSIFKNDFRRWNAVLDNDLSIKFKDPSVLFEPGSSTISPYFHGILAQFIPKYLNVVLQDKYKDKIAEIRIEGHTDDTRIRVSGNSYIDNMELSQDRARNIAFFIVNRQYYHNLNSGKKERFLHLLTANGLSYGRAVDRNYNLISESKKTIDRDKSRRVEFRIIMATDKLIEEKIKNINSK